MKIIGIMGAAGAGKDTTADLIELATRHSVRFAFADKLRQEIAQAYGLDVRVLTDRSLRTTPLEQLALRRCSDPEFVQYAWELATLNAVRPRTIMQRWGDFRRMQNPDFYLAPAEATRVRALFDGHPLMICTDVRFPNEAAWVRRHGGELWRIARPDLVVTDSHMSETSGRDVQADAAITNGGTIDDLRRVVVDLLGEISDAA